MTRELTEYSAKPIPIQQDGNLTQWCDHMAEV